MCHEIASAMVFGTTDFYRSEAIVFDLHIATLPLVTATLILDRYAKIPSLCKASVPLRARAVVRPSHTVGRHVHRLVAMDYHSLGSV